MRNKGNLNVLFVLVLIILVSITNETLKSKSKTKTKSKKVKTYETGMISTKTESDTITLTNYEHDLFYVDASECNAENCPEERGECVTSKRCLCKVGHANLYNDNLFCDYPQKSQKLSFLLEFCLFFGIGHIYSGRYILGIAKLLFIATAITLDCFFKRMDAKSKDKNSLIMFVYSLYLVALLWQIFDIVMIGLNKYTDGNGVPMFVS
jgi:hypothetical protein